jgi:hypothetical protein
MGSNVNQRLAADRSCVLIGPLARRMSDGEHDDFVGSFVQTVVDKVADV